VSASSFATTPDPATTPPRPERTAALLATLPEDVVLVENYVGCESEPPAGPAAERDAAVDAAALTPMGAAPTVPTTPPPAGASSAGAGGHMHPMALPFDRSGGPPLAPATDFSPSLTMASVPVAESRAGLVRWLPVVAAPLLLLSTQVGADRDYPEGIICGSDSGLRTGPMRPRC
jgi:hypothetical protein